MIPNQSISAVGVNYIDSLRNKEISQDREVQRLEMLHKLKEYALPELYRKVLVLRFVQQWTFEDIAEELDIPHKVTAWEIYVKALELLKERKYR